MEDKRKLKIFVASSSEGEYLLEEFCGQLDQTKYEIRKWREVFKISREILDSLTKQIRESDYAIFFLTSDDEVRRNGKGDIIWKPRDNVILESGLSCGILGQKHVIFLEPDGEMRYPNGEMRYGVPPSDMKALQTVRYSVKDGKPDFKAAAKEVDNYINLQEKNAFINSVRPMEIATVTTDRDHEEQLRIALGTYVDAGLIHVTSYDDLEKAKQMASQNEIHGAILDIFSWESEDKAIEFVTYCRNLKKEIPFVLSGKTENLNRFFEGKGKKYIHYWKLYYDVAVDRSFQITVEDIVILFFIYRLSKSNYGSMIGDTAKKIFASKEIGRFGGWEQFF